MDWFERLAANRYIEFVLLANNQGRMLRSSRPLKSDDDLLPSMFQAFEVLAQTLVAEFDTGGARMMQISTERGHILLYPLLSSVYYVAIVVERTAPIMLLTVEIERALRALKQNDLDPFDEMPPVDPVSDLDAMELIEAVREWLRGGTDGS